MRAENGDAARRVRAIQVFRNRDRCCEADASLRAVLIAVKGAPGPAQRVVLDDDAEMRGAVVVAVLATNAVDRPAVRATTSSRTAFDPVSLATRPGTSSDESSQGARGVATVSAAVGVTAARVPRM